MFSLFVDKGSQSDFLHGLLGLKCCPFFFLTMPTCHPPEWYPSSIWDPINPPPKRSQQSANLVSTKKDDSKALGRSVSDMAQGFTLLLCWSHKTTSIGLMTHTHILQPVDWLFFFFLGARVYIPDPLHRIDKQPDQFMLVPQVSWDIFQHTHVHYWGKGVRKMDGKVTKCTFRICRCWHFYEIVLLQQEITDV